MATLSIILTMIVVVCGWFVYAYIFPHTWSGQLLIKVFIYLVKYSFPFHAIWLFFSTDHRVGTGVVVSPVTQQPLSTCNMPHLSAKNDNFLLLDTKTNRKLKQLRENAKDFLARHLISCQTLFSLSMVLKKSKNLLYKYRKIFERRESILNKKSQSNMMYACFWIFQPCHIRLSFCTSNTNSLVYVQPPPFYANA